MKNKNEQHRPNESGCQKITRFYFYYSLSIYFITDEKHCSILNLFIIHKNWKVGSLRYSDSSLQLVFDPGGVNTKQ